MENNTTNSPKFSLFKKQYKDKAFTLHFIRKQVEICTSKPLSQLLKEYSELKRYKLALQFVTTTNKAVCEAMYIPIEAGTKYKRRLEKIGQLVSTIDEFRCPYTGDIAHLLSTNSKEFEKLHKPKDSQLKMFKNEK